MNSTSQVLGRLAATLVQLTLLYAVIAPFAAVAYLLRGIGIGNIAICLIFLFLISAIICSIGLFFGALSMPQGSRNLPRVFGFGIGLIGFLMLMQAPQVLFARRGLWLELAEGGGTVILITAIFTPLLCMLFVSSASTLLTFEADKSWGQSKLSVLLILLALLGLLAGFNTFSKTNIDTDVLKVSTITAYVLVSAATVLFFVLPNRIRYKRIQKLEHRNRIWRLIYYPFMDGPMPALVFFYLCCGILLGSLRLLVETGNFPGVSGEAWLAQGLLLIYAPYLAMIAAGIEKIMINRENRISSKRVMILLSVIIVCMFPIFFIAGARIFEEMTNPATALLPFYYLVFWDDVHEKITLTQLIGPILVGVVLPLFGIATHLIQFLGTDDLSSFNSK